MFIAESLPYSADLADFWLGRAVLHLATTCGMADATVDELVSGVPSATRKPFDQSIEASLRRLDAARMVVLCSALAAEAAVNGYVHARGSSYRTVLEKLPAPDRFVVAPRLLSHTDPFPPGSRLQQQIVRLFELRDELVSPWLPRDDGQVDLNAFARFSPPAARELLEAGARGIDALGELYTHPCGRAAGWARRVAVALSRRAEAAAALPVPTADEIREIAWQADAFLADAPVGA